MRATAYELCRMGDSRCALNSYQVNIENNFSAEHYI